MFVGGQKIYSERKRKEYQESGNLLMGSVAGSPGTG
jgi:hypothetical protein